MQIFSIFFIVTCHCKYFSFLALAMEIFKNFAFAMQIFKNFVLAMQFFFILGIEKKNWPRGANVRGGRVAQGGECPRGANVQGGECPRGANVRVGQKKVWECKFFLFLALGMHFFHFHHWECKFFFFALGMQIFFSIGNAIFFYFWH